MSRFTALLILFVASILSPWTGKAFAFVRSRPVLHAILATDDSAGDLGDSMRRDGVNMESTLRAGIPDNRLRIHKVEPELMTQSFIIGATKNLRDVAENDSVLFYYSGHGAFDPRTKKHVFTLANGDRIARDDVEVALKSLSPNLYVIISDCCATSVRGVSNGLKQVSPSSKSGGVGNHKGVSRLLHQLFFETTGVVNITSSKPGQFSIGLSNGGLFTNAMLTVLRRNAHRTLGWDGLFEETRLETALSYRRSPEIRSHLLRGAGVDQQTQTAWSFGSMYGRDVNGLRLGITICGTCGKHLKSVEPGSTAAFSGLRVGDELLRINGVKVDGPHHAAELIGNSSLVLHIVGQRAETGEVFRKTIELPY